MQIELEPGDHVSLCEFEDSPAEQAVVLEVHGEILVVELDYYDSDLGDDGIRECGIEQVVSFDRQITDTVLDTYWRQLPYDRWELVKRIACKTRARANKTLERYCSRGWKPRDASDPAPELEDGFWMVYVVEE